ncbi:MAG: PQQ-like beta-propeller repeat protein [Planctomycetota bacterium]|nr:PQQ-like beta-propeller repeat protein [Planctomycetota bacterium]
MNLLAFSLLLFQQSEVVGVTIPLQKDWGTQLEDAQNLLKTGHEAIAHALVREILFSEPHLLIPTEEENLFIGAHFAAEKISKLLSPSSTSPWEERANKELHNALLPPSREKLRQVALRFPDFSAGHIAKNALHEIRRDQGYAKTKKGTDFLCAPSVSDFQSLQLPLLHPNDLRPTWSYAFQAPPINSARQGHRMSFSEGVGFLSNGLEITALNLADGRPIWSYSGHPDWKTIPQMEQNRFFKSVHPKKIHAPVVADGIVLVTLLEPVILGREERHLNIDVRRSMPARRLYAFDATDGTLLWKQEVSWNKETNRQPKDLVAGPPAVAHGQVFLPTYDAIGTLDLSLTALDLATGKRLWKRFLVSAHQDSNLFGNLIREPACAPPLLQKDLVILCSQLGAICAVEKNTGRIRWTRLYPRTKARTFQNGRESIRPETFANGPMAATENLLVVAPMDAATAYVLDAETGALEVAWPQMDAQAGPLRHLLGIVGPGAWFSGVTTTFLPFPGQGGRRRQSAPLFDFVSHPNAQSAGTITQNGLLIPSMQAWEWIDPHTAKHQATHRAGYQRALDYGALQSIHGMLFVMNSMGVHAWQSPTAILQFFRRAKSNPEDLADALPLLATLPTHDRILQKRLSLLLQDPPNFLEKEGLATAWHWLKARADLMSQMGPSLTWAKDMQTLFHSESLELPWKSAVLFLDALEGLTLAEIPPYRSILQDALLVIQADAPEKLPRTQGLESKTNVLCQIRFLLAEQPQQQLSAILPLFPRNSQSHAVGIPRQTPWVQKHWNTLMQSADFRQEWEELARTYFRNKEDSPQDQGYRLSLFPGSAAAIQWLENQSKVIEKNTVQYFQHIQWIHAFGGDRIKRLLQHFQAETLYQDSTPPELPNHLQSSRTIDLGESQLLGAQVYGGQLTLLLQDQEGWSWKTYSGDSLHTQRIRRPGNVGLLRNPNATCFLHPNGATLLQFQSLYHLHKNGDSRTTELPGRILQILSLPHVLLLLLETPDRQLVLESRSLQEGTLLFQRVLPILPSRQHRLLLTENQLWILSEKDTQILRVSLPSGQTITPFPLPFLPSAQNIQQAVSYSGGIAITSPPSKTPSFFLVRGNQTEEITAPSGKKIRLFSTPDGFGWWILPQSSYSNEASELQWWSTNSARPTQPKVVAHVLRPQDFEDPRILLHNSTDDSMQAIAWDFPLQGDPTLLWKTDLLISKSSLSHQKTASRFSETHTLLPLTYQEEGLNQTFLQLLLFDQQGREVGRHAQRIMNMHRLYSEILSLPGLILLRIQNQIHVLGELPQ